MSTIALVHGGGHGAWCWEPLMSQLDVPSLAVDLPGRGKNPMPIEETDQHVWAESVIDLIVRNDLNDIVLTGIRWAD